MDEVAYKFMDTIKHLQLEDEVCLLIDESGFSKKGKNSFGVKQQYNGNKGKLDNCQVGVFGALNAGSLTALTHAELYNNDNGISKIEHAKNIIDHTINVLEINPACVNFDAFYGRDTGLLAYLNKKGIKFIGDVPEKHQIYLEAFQMRVPKSKGTRGRKSKNAKPTKTSIAIKDYAKTLSKNDFKEIKIRYGSKGIIRAKVHIKQVYVLNPITNKCMALKLYIRKDGDGSIYYCLTNFNDEVTIKEIAYYQSKRYFIERSFQECKDDLGMHQYQVRSEIAWLRHMALCMLTYLFIQTEKTLNYKCNELYISASDIRLLIATIIYSTKKQIEKIKQKILDKYPKTKELVRKKIFLRI